MIEKSEKTHDEHAFSGNELLERLEKIEQAANIGHWEVNLVSGKTIWSKHFYSILGIDPSLKEPSPQLFFSSIHPEDLEVAEEAYQEAINSGSSFSITKRILLRSGEIRIVNTKGTVETDNQGKPFRVFGVSRNVTAEVQESELAKREDLKIENILSTTQDLIFIMDGNGIFRKVSSSIKEIMGLKPEDLIGKPFQLFSRPSDMPANQNGLEQLFKEKKIKGIVKSYQKPSGEVIQLSWTGSYDASSGLIYAIGRDVTQQKTIEEAVKNEKQKLDSILNTSPDLIWSLDHKLCLTAGNEAFKANLKENVGWEIQVGDYLPSNKYFPKDHGAKWKKLYEKALSGETVSFESEIYGSDKTTYSETKINPIKVQNQVIGLACFSRNITALKEKEASLNDLVNKLNIAQGIGKIGYWELDLDTEEIFWSDEIYKIWEMPNKGKHPNLALFESTIHPEDLPEFLAHQTGAFKGLHPLDKVHRIIPPSGKIKYVHEKGGLVTDPHTGRKVIRGTVQDISSEKEIENQLIERNLFIESTLKNLPLGISVNQISTGKATYINPAFSQIYGWPESHLTDVQTFFEKIYPDPVFREKITKEILDDLKSGDPARLEWKDIPIETQNQGTRIISAKNIPLPEQDLMISTVKDETDRYWAEQALIKSNERFHLATQAISDAVSDWDISSDTIFWGKGYHKLFGFPADQESVKPDFWESRIHPDDKERMLKSVQEARKDPSVNRWSEEYRFKKYDGSYAYVKENTVIIRDESGKPNRIVGALQDITSDKITSEQLLFKTQLISTTSAIIESLLETENWEKLMDRILMLMGKAVNADRSYFFKIFKDNQERLFAQQTHEWATDEVTAELENPDYQAIPLDDHPVFLEAAMQRKPFSFLVKDATGETRAILEEQNIKSILQIPVFVENELFGYAGFDDCTTERIWTEDEKSFMHSITTNLAFAIERKQNLDKIAKALESKNRTLESIGDAFYSLDHQYAVTYWNHRAEKLTDVPRDEILGRNIWEFLGENANPDFRVNISNAFIENQPTQFETFDPYLKTWLEVNIYPSEEGLSIFLKDISERKEAEKEIAQFNERFAIISNASNDAIWDWNLMTGEHYWGEGFNKLFEENVAGIHSSNSSWEKRIHPDDRNRVVKMLERSLQDPTITSFDSEYRFIRKYDSFYYVQDKGTIIRDEQGNAQRMVGAIHDITPRKRYEESLKKLNNELARSNQDLSISNKELEQFAYVASHDLQEPLRMISSFLGLIERKYGHLIDEKGKQYIHFAVDGAKRMRDIILDLLDFSRLGNISEEKKPVDCLSTIQDILLFNKRFLKEREARIHLGELPKIVAHPNAVLQLFQNLIINAVKYQPKNQIPQVWIEGEKKEKFWHFTIRDNGIGINPQYQEKIFIIFQRLHQKEEFSGSGIGLAICRKITEIHGGKIWVESEEGKGSTFHFTISIPD